MGFAATRVPRPNETHTWGLAATADIFINALVLGQGAALKIDGAGALRILCQELHGSSNAYLAREQRCRNPLVSKLVSRSLSWDAIGTTCITMLACCICWCDKECMTCWSEQLL